MHKHMQNDYLYACFMLIVMLIIGTTIGRMILIMLIMHIVMRLISTIIGRMTLFMFLLRISRDIICTVISSFMLIMSFFMRTIMFNISTKI